MKYFLLFAVICSANFSFASECQQIGKRFEFLAKATNVQKYALDEMGTNAWYECSYNLTDFKGIKNDHQCPMSEAEVQNALLRDSDCKVTEGQSVNGVLVLKNGLYWIL